MQHFFLCSGEFAQSQISAQPVLSWAKNVRSAKENSHKARTGPKLFKAFSPIFHVLLPGFKVMEHFCSWPSPTMKQRTIPAHEEKNLLSPASPVPTCPAALQNRGCDLTHSEPLNQPGIIFCSFRWSRPVLSGLIPSLITSTSFGFGLFPEEEVGGPRQGVCLQLLESM